jgi:tight adherence protein B
VVEVKLNTAPFNSVALGVGPAVLGIGAALRVALKVSARSRVHGRLPRTPGATQRGLRPMPAPAWFVRALDDAAIRIEPAAAWTAAATGVCLLTVVGAMVGGPALSLLAGAAGAGGAAVVLVSRRGRAASLLEQALPGALEAVARSLRSGASLRAAVAEAAAATDGALGAELARVDADARRGVPLVVALDALAVRLPLPGVRLAVAALSLGVETGGAQARAVDGVATTLRDRIAAHAEGRALAAQTRASVWVIAVSPAAFCAFAVTTDPRTARFFFRSAPGLTFLALGLALDGAGALWMRRLSSVDP